MKNLLYIALSSALIFTSCDKGFEDINVDPTVADQIDIKYKFPQTVLNASGSRYETWRANFIYCSTMIQHLANTQGYWNGDKYTLSRGYAEAYWQNQYQNTIKHVEDMKAQLIEEGKENTPEYAMVRILRVYAFHKITDLYGDVPYSEAGKAYIEGNLRPAYDTQEFIYKDMLNELEESSALLTSGVSELGNTDIIFNGDLSKWKKWSNSLMLRLALRLVKVEPETAKEWATKAINGGVMESNDDIAYVAHEIGNGILQNSNGEVFLADRSSRISKTFMDFLQGDPRLRIYAALPDGNNDISVQKGLPNGLDANTISDYSGGDDLSTYSETNSKYLQGRDAPMFFQTYAEVEFMLAESALRWGIGSGDAETHYNNGIEAAMTYLTLYSEEAVITDQEIADYIAANPYNEANGLELINTQYWAAIFLNELEAYANWRRTGYPTLTPVNYPGNVTNGQIPRRLTYMTNEQVTNKENYDAAVERQGEDLLTTRIWWDAE